MLDKTIVGIVVHQRGAGIVVGCRGCAQLFNKFGGHCAGYAEQPVFNFQRNLVRFVEETVTERERVTVTVVDVLLEAVTDRVRLPVTVRVNGCVVGMPLTERVMLTEMV